MTPETVLAATVSVMSSIIISIVFYVFKRINLKLDTLSNIINNLATKADVAEVRHDVTIINRTHVSRDEFSDLSREVAHLEKDVSNLKVKVAKPRIW